MVSEFVLRPLRSVMTGLEKMSQTRANYWAEFMLDSLLALALLGVGISSPEIGLARMLLLMAGGLLVFSFFEYTIHRWLFHRFNSILSQGHDGHHHNPLGYDALPFFLPSLVVVGVIGLMHPLVSDPVAYIFCGSLLSGYLIYGASHHIIHHIRFDRPWAKRWAAMHHVHHVHPGTNFGVTSPLWDILLGTRYIPPRRRR